MRLLEARELLTINGGQDECATNWLPLTLAAVGGVSGCCLASMFPVAAFFTAAAHQMPADFVWSFVGISACFAYPSFVLVMSGGGYFLGSVIACGDK